MDVHLELELRKMLAEREIRRQLFDYHEAMNRADYEALTALMGDAVITVCDAPSHRARTEPVSTLRPEQRVAVINGGAQFVAGCRATWLTYDGDPRMQFGATNVVVDVADSLDSATCHTYFFLFQGLRPGDHPDQTRHLDQTGHPDQTIQADHPDLAVQDVAAQLGLEASSEFPLQVISCGRYFDTYRYHNEAWRIVTREIYADFAGDVSRHMRA
jgi:SnoaL-like domain